MTTVIQTQLEGVVEIQPVRHGDDRGWFSETWNQASLNQAGIEIAWVQDNESFSAAAGTVRGIHFQRPPSAQDKLVRVIAGRILDIAVDLRQSSPTFGRHVAVELTANLGNQLLIPKGFGHGFATLEPNCHVAYKVSAPYDPDADAAIHWTDPDLALPWGVTADAATVSAKDGAAPRLASATKLLFQ